MGECIIGKRIGRNGYARLPGGKRGVHIYEHRAVWEATHGPIPAGYHVHHTCQTKACVNIHHLELLTPREHFARHRRCDHDDRYVKADGKTECRECRRERDRTRYATDAAYRDRHRAKALARGRKILADPELREKRNAYRRAVRARGGVA